jgi:hypothetical protein
MPLKMPVRLLIRFITISLVVTTCNYYTITHLHSLQSLHSSILSVWSICHSLGIFRNLTALLSQSHIATDGQSVSLVSSPIWGSWPDVNYCFDSYGLVFYGASSLTRGRVCLLYMLLALASAVFLGSELLGTRDHILLSQTWDFPFRPLTLTCSVISVTGVI